MNISEANVEAEDSIPVAAVGCLHAISIVLESVNKLSHLYVQIEPILLPIMQRMLTPEGEGIESIDNIQFTPDVVTPKKSHIGCY